MGILGIENRTENWKTAKYIIPLSHNDDARVNLARMLGESEETRSEDVRIELFWKGMRDHFNMVGRKVRGDASDSHDLAEFYDSLFPDLRQEIDTSNLFAQLKDGNYDVSGEDGVEKLRNNVCNTEIDIVIETPNTLFIGEAKGESRLGADGKLVLVHQLIRQYVTAKILIDFLGCDKEVIPFIVADDVAGVKRTHQVKFMIRQGWLKEDNILSWDDIPS